MAIEARLQLSDGSNTFVFNLGGVVVPSQRYNYRTVAGLVELESIEERWPVTGAAILSTTVALTATALDTFLAHLETRGAGALDRAIMQISDGAGGWTTTRTLGVGNNQQEFVIEGLDWGAPDPRLGGTVQRLSLPINLTVGARRVFPDGNGIVNWLQRVSITAGQDALRVVEWRTEIEVAAGAATTALALAQIHAVIPMESYGSSYVWDTNSEDGFDLEYPEADEANSLVPTVISCVSRIRQKGEAIGTPTAGNSIGNLTTSVETILEGLRTTTITRVTAIGPGALDAVRGRKPSGGLSYEREVNGTSDRVAEGEWHTMTQEVVRWRIEAVASGGHQDMEYAERGGNEPPELVLGAFLPVRLALRVVVSFMGRSPSPSAMQFPARLGEPWKLVRNETGENTTPRRVEVGTTRDFDMWEREVNLAYIAREPSSEAYTALLALTDDDQETLTSYVFEEA